MKQFYCIIWSVEKTVQTQSLQRQSMQFVIEKNRDLSKIKKLLG